MNYGAISKVTLFINKEVALNLIPQKCQRLISLVQQINSTIAEITRICFSLRLRFQNQQILQFYTYYFVQIRSPITLLMADLVVFIFKYE